MSVNVELFLYTVTDNNVISTPRCGENTTVGKSSTRTVYG